MSGSSPFALDAYADGRAMGSTLVDAGIPEPDELPSFWRMADPRAGHQAERLVPVTGAATTRSSCIWLLTPDEVIPDVESSLSLDDFEPARSGNLWRISGQGILRMEGWSCRIRTLAGADPPDSRLFAFGKTLGGWRHDQGAPVHQGQVIMAGQAGDAPLAVIPKRELRSKKGRILGSEFIEWIRSGSPLARCRIVRLPEGTEFSLHEANPGILNFRAKGLDNGWRLRLGAGGLEVEGQPAKGFLRLKLVATGATPGLVQLRLSEPATGRVLILNAAWPAQSGIILDPDGMRLTRDEAISVKALHGWRAMAPDGVACDLRLQTRPYRPVVLPLMGEVSLASHLPLIEAMLAQGGPDAQVNLNLIVSGIEGPKLKIRRYRHNAVVQGDTLWLGLGRDEFKAPETTLSSGLAAIRQSRIFAVNLHHLMKVEPADTSGEVRLREHLGKIDGPWLLQSSLDGQIQRSAVWSADEGPQQSRDERIDIYVSRWRWLVANPDNANWEQYWQLIKMVSEGGDAGSLDQVQALAKVPAALTSLALRVPADDLPDVLALESVTPVFWPTLEVAAFTKAVEADYKRRQLQLAPLGHLLLQQDTDG